MAGATVSDTATTTTESVDNYSINGSDMKLNPEELFGLAFSYISEEIIPKLRKGVYKAKTGNKYFEYGNYSKSKIESFKHGGHMNKQLPEKFITFIIPIKDRDERMLIQLQNLLSVLDFKQVDCLIIEDEIAAALDSDKQKTLRKKHWTNRVKEEIWQKIRYYKVKTGVSWSRSMLMNFGISKTTTPLILACDVDFIFPPNFMKYLKRCCTKTDFKQYAIGLPLWESHDSFRNNSRTQLLRTAYEPYSACYIYSTKVVKMLGGFDRSIINHGTEERELQKRLTLNGYETIYGHLLFSKAYVVHYSHDNISRGVGRTEKDRDYIMSKNGKKITFRWDLPVLQIIDNQQPQKKEQEQQQQKKHQLENQRLEKEQLEKQPNKNINKDVLFVIGNGPSLKSVDFDLLKGYDTFGLNSAYRKYGEIGYPTYHGCFDYVVCECHKDQFSNLVLHSPIQRFFYLEPKYFSKKITDSAKFQKINFNLQKIENLSHDFHDFHDMGCSGANAVQCGILMGYKRIILLGCDCNYVNMVEGSVRLPNGELIMGKTPTQNPNYWFDDYQQSGDKYNPPQADTLHTQSWERIARIIAKENHRNVEIINCSLESAIKCFKKMSLDDVIKLLAC